MFVHVVFKDASYSSPVMSDTESANMTLEAGTSNPQVCKTSLLKWNSD